MDYLGNKINSLTGDALSGISEMQRKRRRQKDTEIGSQQEDAIRASATAGAPNDPLQPQCDGPPGIPFGGETFATFSLRPAALPIGFRTDLVQGQPSSSNPMLSNQVNIPKAGNDQLDPAASSESLYQGDAWSRLWFQRVMVLSLIRLLMFVRKVYEDYQATGSYQKIGQYGRFLVAAATLFLPTVIFTIYRVARYLQVALPPVRQLAAGGPYPNSNRPRTVQAAAGKAMPKAGNDRDSQLRKALMSSPASGSQSPTNQPDDEGLVTASQTPTNEEFHDSKSEPDQNISTSPAPSTAVMKDSPPQPQDRKLESVNIERLGNIPDKSTMRLVIGSSEQLLHGILFIFWQLKRQVDVLGYLVERSCLWRKPRDVEKEELGRLRTGSDGLEWFQDFYAAFLAILAQVYTLGLVWHSEDGKLTSSTSLNSLNMASSESADGALAQIVKSLGFLQSDLQKSLGVNEKDSLIMSELFVSSAMIVSLLIAVRRLDDGPLTLGLSMLGWGSLFASRVITLGLFSVHVNSLVVILLVTIHVIGVTFWIYKIAIDSHNGKPSESEEYKWDLEQGDRDIELKESPVKQSEQLQQTATSQWSTMEHVILVAQIVTLFAIPSLFYWPIMFNLKMHFRPFKYLVLILSENFIIILLIWFTTHNAASVAPWSLLVAVGCFSIMGFLFISLYVLCKPSLTEYFARADELFRRAESSGVYYEFCSRVFKMPDLGKHAFRRLMNQSEQIEDEVEIQFDD